MHIINIHEKWLKHSLWIFEAHFGAKIADFLRKSLKLLPVNSSLLNHQWPLFAPKGDFKVTIFWTLIQNATKWSLFVLWPMGCYGDIFWGIFIKKLLTNRQILEKMCNHFIFTSILNPIESSYDKCYKLSFLMSQTQFLYSIGNFGAKSTDFLKKICNTITSKY
jgi:hypothetical protein